ncbi:hypothetical protein [Arthrobacter sp. zg-Y895]|uniref:hypothetical protein n=1 Tax=Arthrobacter sp. zg-Y895 TaxID=2886933 RepID=UPI001D148365|nr:hypothetical protein [Arthrobacter sp. zg-Y895]MCC3302142.1 hypothetical protein [Arthrobacter sp. zg-Y895]
MKRHLSAIAVSLLAAALLCGCDSSHSPEYSDTIGNEEPPIDEYRPEEQPGWAADESEIPRYFPEPSGWACHYNETYNYDWHDDVICTNGAQSHRPYLLEGYDFVAYQDIMAAAAEYEVYLNSQ